MILNLADVSSLETTIYLDSLMQNDDGDNPVSLESSGSSQLIDLSLQTVTESMFVEDSLDPRPQFNLDNLELQEKMDDNSFQDEPSNDFGNKSFAMNFSDNFADMKMDNFVDMNIDDNVDIDNVVDPKTGDFQKPDDDDDEEGSLESFLRYHCYKPKF